jgi:hypothetical protein
MVVAVATNNMAVAVNTVEHCKLVQIEMQKHFDTSDLGELTWFLGFEVK